jgi:hypothetical protein
MSNAPARAEWLIVELVQPDVKGGVNGNPLAGLVG